MLTDESTVKSKSQKKRDKNKKLASETNNKINKQQQQIVKIVFKRPKPIQLLSLCTEFFS